MSMLSMELAGNTLQAWFIAVVIAVSVFFALTIIRVLMLKQLDRVVAQSEVFVLHVLAALARRTRWLFLFILALYLGVLFLTMPQSARSLINTAVLVLVIFQAGVWLTETLRVSVENYHKNKITSDPASVTTLNVINFIGRIVIWSIVLLLVLDNLGVNITALVAGLGVGGIAVALALQTVLSDLFASLSIVLDKPFVVGDFLIVGDLLGSVEYVGLKTTRLRSLSGEQLVFSNTDLLNSRIRNFGRMFQRRVPFNIGVTYQTSREKLMKIPEIIRQAVELQTDTRFDRSHFKEYGDFSLVFESVYFVLGPDYNKFMDIHQAVNLHIHERFEQEGIEFAYPTQTLYLHGEK